MKTYTTKKIKQAGFTLMLLTAIMVISMSKSQAQIDPLGSVYFQNQYLANPAMAGLKKGLRLNLGYRQQWSSMPGSPQTQSLTGDYGFSNRVGLGINLYNDQAGLLKQTRVMGTYAYHLPVGDEDQQLNFGLSLGYMNQRITYEDLRGDAGDVNVGRFNEQKAYVDGDFGLSYTSSKLTVQGAVPNLKAFLKQDENRNTADLSTFYTAVSYKFSFGESINRFSVEPKAVYRGVRGYKNITDLGGSLSFIDNSLILTGMYHSSNSATFGVGMDYKHSFSIIGMYTTQTSALNGFTNGNFEVGLKLNVL